ncbi:hypothetical protein [Promicromonospora sp. NPDC057488]|uniref:hypothetical protein n=1 Tax=Promicromonospora sp. NPDC057488 TaxID=3346147 RepID=UPI0036731E79
MRLLSLSVGLAFVSGCSSLTDVDDISGVYENVTSGAEIHLEPDGTFSASGISADQVIGSGGSDPVEFAGRWEFVDSAASSDFVYLLVDEGELGGAVGGVQLYLSGGDAVEFFADADGPPSLVLDRQD